MLVFWKMLRTYLTDDPLQVCSYSYLSFYFSYVQVLCTGRTLAFFKSLGKIPSFKHLVKLQYIKSTKIFLNSFIFLVKPSPVSDYYFGLGLGISFKTISLETSEKEKDLPGSLNLLMDVILGCCRCSPSEVFLGKGVLKICSKVSGKYPCRSAISIKLLFKFIEIVLRHGCSHVNLLHFFRTLS